MNVQQHHDGIHVAVRVQPRASNNILQVEDSGVIKLRLTSPPVDGEANRACIELIAATFGVPKYQVSLVSGHKGRNKVVCIQGVSLQSVQVLLQQYRKS